MSEQSNNNESNKHVNTFTNFKEVKKCQRKSYNNKDKLEELDENEGLEFNDGRSVYKENQTGTSSMIAQTPILIATKPLVQHTISLHNSVQILRVRAVTLPIALKIAYVSPCEVVWRIFGFELHYRSVAVERLSFYLLDEYCVLFDDEDPTNSVLDKAWMDFNKSNEEGRQYCYHEFPTYYAWHQDNKEWKTLNGCQKTIGRIYHVPLGTGATYYLRIILNHVKRPTCYEGIRTVNGVVHPFFKEACYAMGLLDDEKEYIDGIVEANFWSSAHYLCSLFAMLLLFGSLSRPEFIWEQT
ncbi:LOW QUALITY PROTEIN: hypothetical protein V2J09_021304 [Rumex salicifolius]